MKFHLQSRTGSAVPVRTTVPALGLSVGQRCPQAAASPAVRHARPTAGGTGARTRCGTPSMDSAPALLLPSTCSAQTQGRGTSTTTPSRPASRPSVRRTRMPGASHGGGAAAAAAALEKEEEEEEAAASLRDPPPRAPSRLRLRLEPRRGYPSSSRWWWWWWRLSASLPLPRSPCDPVAPPLSPPDRSPARLLSRSRSPSPLRLRLRRRLAPESS